MRVYTRVPLKLVSNRNVRRLTLKVEVYNGIVFARNASYATLNVKEYRIGEVRIEEDSVLLTPPGVTPKHYIDLTKIVDYVLVILETGKPNVIVSAGTRDSRYNVKIASCRMKRMQIINIFGTLNLKTRDDASVHKDWLINTWIDYNMLHRLCHGVYELLIVNVDGDRMPTGVVLVTKHECATGKCKDQRFKALMPGLGFGVKISRRQIMKLAKYNTILDIHVNGDDRLEKMQRVFRILEDALEHVAGAVLAESL